MEWLSGLCVSEMSKSALQISCTSYLDFGSLKKFIRIWLSVKTFVLKQKRLALVNGGKLPDLVKKSCTCCYGEYILPYLPRADWAFSFVFSFQWYWPQVRYPTQIKDEINSQYILGAFMSTKKESPMASGSHSGSWAVQRLFQIVLWPATIEMY